MALFCLGVLFIGGCSNRNVPASVADWHEHKDGNLVCKLPRKPQMQSHKIDHPLLGKIDFKIYLCEISRDSGLMVSNATYPISPDAYDARAGLEGATEGMASNIKGKIESKTNIKHKSLEGREVVVSAPNNLFAKARIYIDANGPTLYQFQAIGKKSFLDDKVVTDFFDSIDIKPMEKSKPSGSKKLKGGFEK